MPQHHMVLPHYNPKEISRQDSFSPQTPPDDIPLLLPHEANDPDSSTMENKSNGLDSSGYNPTAVSFVDNADTENISAPLLEELSESNMQVNNDWLETREHVFHDTSTSEVTEVGPRALCHCQVSYKSRKFKIIL